VKNDILYKKKVYIYGILQNKMTDCQPDDWIAGLWFVVSGIMLAVAGCLSLFVVDPILRK